MSNRGYNIVLNDFFRLHLLPFTSDNLTILINTIRHSVPV